MTFGQWLRMKRLAMGLNQTKFAYLIEVTQNDVSRYENNKQQLTSINVKNRIEKALGAIPSEVTL